MRNEIKREPAGPGRRNKWLSRNPKIAPFYTAAIEMLMTGPRSQKPSWRAVRKMMVVLATAPRVQLVGLGKRVPYPMTVPQHVRNSWRSYPHIAITANLEVAS
jgi:hypothetical protein